MSPEDARNDVPRCRRDWCAMRDMFLASHGENDCVSLGGHDVGANFIQVENDSGHEWGGAVLRSSDLPHAIGVHGDVLRVAIADRVREIQQDAVRTHRSVNFRLNRGTDCDFDP